MHIVKQSKPYDAEHGDVLYGAEYFIKIESVKEVSTGKKILIPCHFNTPTSWYVLHKAGVENALEVQDKLLYDCPFVSRNRYFWAIPILICAKDPTVYDYIPDHWRDDDFLRNHSNIIEHLDSKEARYSNAKLSDLQRAILGHGYTDSTLPTDGSNGIELAAVELSNGDKVIVAMWVWYNK